MRSFIKIYGPPVIKAIKELEKVAVDVPEVSIMNTVILHNIPAYFAREIGGAPPTGRMSDPLYSELAREYFSPQDTMVPLERLRKIISRSGEVLGPYDFFFEWFKDPSTEQLNELIEKIDGALKPLGCLYTITTKEKETF